MSESIRGAASPSPRARRGGDENSLRKRSSMLFSSLRGFSSDGSPKKSIDGASVSDSIRGGTASPEQRSKNKPRRFLELGLGRVENEDLVKDADLSKFLSIGPPLDTSSVQPAPIPIEKQVQPTSNAGISTTMNGRIRGGHDAVAGLLDEHQNEAQRHHEAVTELQQKLMHEMTERESLLSSLEASKVENEDLRTRLQSSHSAVALLNEKVSSSATIEGQLPDEHFKEGVDRLTAQLQEWVMAYFKQYRIRFDKLSPTAMKVLEQVGMSSEAEAQISKIALMRSVAMSKTMHIFNEPLFFGMPDTEHHNGLRAFGEHLKQLASFSSYNQWRSLTARLLADMKIDTEDAVRRLAHDIDTTLSEATGAEADVKRVASLTGILDSAVLLSRQMRSQRARFTAEFPEPGPKASIKFDDEFMQDVGTADLPARSKFVQFGISPSLKKLGDEKGEKELQRSVLVKAKVTCKAR